MIYSAEHIGQPYSGEYVEKIYDISSPWNSSEWSWIKFEEDNGEWCGEFRGKFRGIAISKKFGCILILTSDYLYTLDIETAELIKYESQPEYIDITVSTNGDIFITDGYYIEMLVENQQGDLECEVPEELISLPIDLDDLRFVGWKGEILKMHCRDYWNWEKEIELFLDSNSMELLDITNIVK